MGSKFSLIGYAWCILVSMSAGAWAGEKPLVDVNFNRFTWTELLKKDYGPTSSVVSGALQLASGTVFRTLKLPYRPGQIVTIEVEAKCQNVVQGNADYMVGWATLSGYDASQVGMGHLDVLQIRGTTDWATYTIEGSFNEQARFITIDLTHQGSAGTVWYRNLKVWIRDWQTQELIEDSGFEGQLGVDTWYYKQSGTDWNGLTLWGTTGTIAYDTSVVVTGTNALKMTGTRTMVSKEFSYNGETLILSGWLRSTSLIGSNGGGIQLVGLDEWGNYVTHENLKIITGTNAWKFYTLEKTFPESVKKVQVWLRKCVNTTGTIWFDEVRLERMEEEPLPFDKDNATITVDVSSPGEVINHDAWAGIDVLYCWWLLRPDVQNTLPYLQQAGFKYIRFREISNGLNLYDTDDAYGNPVYNWTKFDQLCDLLVGTYNFIPVITIETTPPALDRPGTRVYGWTNPTAPADFTKWGAYIEAIFEHVVQRYGTTEAQKWLWEIWNEPCLPSTAGYYVGTTEDFVALAEQVYLAAERVEQRHNINLKIGLTSGGLGEQYILNRLQTLGKLSWVDHHTGHYYAGASSSIKQVPDWINELDEYKTLYPGMNDYLIGCTEWNCTAMQSQLLDLPWNATLAFKMAKTFVDRGLDYSTFFALADHPELYSLPPALFISGGSQGMFTRGDNPVAKPVYNAFVFLNELRGGQRLTLTTTNDPIDGMATLKPDGSIAIVLASYDEDTSRQPYTTQVAVTLQGVQGTYKCTRLWAADEEYGNSYGAWLELGSPDVNDATATPILIERSKYAPLDPIAVTSGNGTVQFVVNIPGPGIRFIEITPYETEVLIDEQFNEASGTPASSYWQTYTTVANAPAIVQNDNGQLVVPVGIGDGGVKGLDPLMTIGTTFYRFEANVTGNGCHIHGFMGTTMSGPHVIVRSDCGSYWVVEISNGATYARYTTDLSAWSRYQWAIEWYADRVKVYAFADAQWQLKFDSDVNSPDSGTWSLPSVSMVPFVSGYWAPSAATMEVDSLKVERYRIINTKVFIDEQFNETAGTPASDYWATYTTVPNAPAIAQNGSGQLVVPVGIGDGGVKGNYSMIPVGTTYYRLVTNVTGDGCHLQGFESTTTNGPHIYVRSDCGSFWVVDISNGVTFARYTTDLNAWSRYQWTVEWYTNRVKVYALIGTVWELKFDSSVNSPDSGTWVYPSSAMVPFVMGYWANSSATMYVDSLKVEVKYEPVKITVLANDQFNDPSGTSASNYWVTSTTVANAPAIVQDGTGVLVVPVGPGQGDVKGQTGLMPEGTTYCRFETDVTGGGAHVHGFMPSTSNSSRIYVRNDCGSYWVVEISNGSTYARRALDLSAWTKYRWAIEWYVGRVRVYAYIGDGWQLKIDSDVNAPDSGSWSLPISALKPFVTGYSQTANTMYINSLRVEQIELINPPVPDYTNFIPGDANGDGMVDVGDLGILAANYGKTSGATWAMGDFNGDGAVDVGDLGILAANYGTNASSADWTMDYAKAFGTKVDENVDSADGEIAGSICSGLGLPLIAGLLLVGLTLMKLEE
jgi:beta-xylosidase